MMRFHRPPDLVGRRARPIKGAAHESDLVELILHVKGFVSTRRMRVPTRESCDDDYIRGRLRIEDTTVAKAKAQGSACRSSRGMASRSLLSTSAR